MINILKEKMIFNEKGFSMIEMMIALVLLMVGLLAVAQMQIAAIQGNSSANRMSRATTLGSDRIEKLIKRSYKHADLTEGDHADAANPIDNYYNIFWTVSAGTGGTTTTSEDGDDGTGSEGGGVSADKFKSITLTVKWTERGFQKKMVFNYIKADTS